MDEIKIIDYYFPENDESRMAIKVNLNGHIFEGIVVENFKELKDLL
ncbi:MAG: hypothetical protein AABY22_29725 [Nanoarchaeota archaeon]